MRLSHPQFAFLNGALMFMALAGAHLFNPNKNTPMQASHGECICIGLLLQHEEICLAYSFLRDY